MNKSIFIGILLLVIFIQSSIGQDTIFFKSNDKVLAIISEISEAEIRYKNYTNPTGPDYLISVNLVSKIVFSSGDIKTFEKKVPDFPFKRNSVAFHIFDLMLENVTISYEHIFKKGKYGIKIPLSFGLIPSDAIDGPGYYSNVFYSGVGLNIYLAGQRDVSYFLGPELNLGIGSENISYWGREVEKRFFYGRLLINNGVAYTPVPNFRLVTVMGLGLRNYNLYNSYYDGVEPAFYFTLSLGYRF